MGFDFSHPRLPVIFYNENDYDHSHLIQEPVQNESENFPLFEFVKTKYNEIEFVDEFEEDIFDLLKKTGGIL